MESLSILGVIYRVAKEITKAAGRARQCKKRCQELASRVEVVANLVRESEAAPDDSATRTCVLDRLRDALQEALQVVQSCRSRSSFPKLLLAVAGSSSIDNVERKINNCLLELGVANDVRLLGLGNQQTTTARRWLAAHDAVPYRPKLNTSWIVPIASLFRPNTIVNNSGIVKINGAARPSTVVVNNSGIVKINAVAKPTTVVNDSGIVKINGVARPNNAVNNSEIAKKFGDSSSRSRSRSRRGRRIRKSAAPAAGPKMLSTTTRPAASASTMRTPQAGRDIIPRRSESSASRSTENQDLSFPDFKANDGPWTPPPQGFQDCQYPYTGAGDGGHGFFHYFDHHSVEDDPNSCSIM